jgi:hypothetical protein
VQYRKASATYTCDEACQDVHPQRARLQNEDVQIDNLQSCIASRKDNMRYADPKGIPLNPFASLVLYIRPGILTDPLSIYISTLFIFETGFEKPLTSPIQ